MNEQDAAPNLAKVQGWFQAAITASGGAVPERWDAEDAATPVGFPVRSSGIANALQRIGIYRRGYWLRLLDAMRSQFPLLRSWLNDSLFDEFALEYLQRHPPTSHTLDRLGDSFPCYLIRSATSAGARGSWVSSVVDLARLEQAICFVAEGYGPEGMRLASPFEVMQLEEREFLSWCPLAIPGIRLLAFDYPVHDIARALATGKEVRVSTARPCVVAVFRCCYRVELIEMTSVQAEAIAALDGQTSVARIIDTRWDGTYSSQLTEPTLRCWLGHWANCQLLRKVIAVCKPPC